MNDKINKYIDKLILLEERNTKLINELISVREQKAKIINKETELMNIQERLKLDLNNNYDLLKKQIIEG